MAKRIDEIELKALLSDEIRSAITYDATELSDKRSRALEYYRGEMRDTPAMTGRSSVVSRDVADTIGWMLPGIIRVFTAPDRMVDYEPVGTEDEEFAEIASDYANHIFFKDNLGYRILWDSTHDALLQGNGIVKHFWDESEQCTYEVMTGRTEEELAILLQDEEDVEIVAQTEGKPAKMQVADQMGQPIEVEVPTFDVKVKRVTKDGRLVIECIEPENFLLDKDARYIEESRFCAHRAEKSRSDLIEMGFPRDVVENLPADRGSAFLEETIAREQEYDGLRNDVGHESTRIVELYECYIKVDVDGDGIAEMVRAYYAGASGAGELLDWEVWEDDVPFSDIPCEPVPHRWDARSVADETTDVQRIKTVLIRQMLDNLYASNIPMREVEVETVVNPEMLTAPKFGGIIWRKKGTMATAPIMRHEVPFVADKVLNGVEFFDQVVEKRTGVSRAAMALDPNTLQNQTATANQNQRDAAYSQIELIARNMAELGWKRVFRQILKLIVKHQSNARIVRLRGRPVKVDPRVWNADMDATVNVGLGTGSRDRDMAMLNNILGGQVMVADRLAQGGFMDRALDMLPKVVNTLKKIAESAGLKNPDSYYPEIGEQDVGAMKQQAQERAAQPDPKVQVEQQKLEADIAKGQAQLQLDQQKAASQMQMEQVKSGADLQLQREKMAGEMAIKREQIMMEMQLKREQLAAELALKRDLSVQEMQIKRDVGFYSADAKASAVKAKTSGVHVGGQPG